MAGGDVLTSRLKASENTLHYMRMRDSGHLDFVKKARVCTDFLAGRQWDSAVLAKLRAENRPALTINKIFPATMALMGEQLQNMVDVAFRPTASGNEETANALDIAWLHVANSNMMDWRRAEVFDDGAVCSRGYYDVRISFDDNLRGDVRIRRVNNRNVLLDPDANSYDMDDHNELIVTKWLMPDQIAATYDTAKAKELESRASQDHNINYDFVDYPTDRFGGTNAYPTLVMGADRKKFIRIIERQYKQLVWREHFVDMVTGETRVIPSTWDHERISRVVQTVPDLTVLRLQAFVYRWTVSALDVLLFDAETPYKHFTVVPYFPLLVGGVTLGMVENQVGPQETINKTTSQELHIVNTTANSGWKIKTNSLKNMDVYELEEKGATTGLVLELDDVNSAEKIQPNSVPQGLDLISQRARQDHFETSLVNKSMLGIDREDVSGKAIERKQLRGPVNMSKALANLVRAEHMVARNTLDLIQAFWTEERLLRVTRKERGRDVTQELTINQMTPEGNVVNDVTLGEYHVITSTVSLREQHEDTEFDQALALRQLGVSISDEDLITLSRLRNKKDILKRMSDSAEERAQDLERERALKQAELDMAQIDTQVRKTDAMEKVARATRTDKEGRAKEVQLQLELAKLLNQIQVTNLEADRLKLEAKKVDAEIEQMRRDSRLAVAKHRQQSKAATKR